MSSVRGTVYLASVASNLSGHIKKLIPNIPLVEIEAGLIEDNLTEVKRKLQDVEILVCEPPLISKLLHETSLPLKFVHSTWAGVNCVMDAYDPKKGRPLFTLTRTATGYGQVMGEYVIGHIIANEKRFRDTYTAQKDHNWASKSLYKFRQLTDLNIGILGLGHIGTKAMAGVARQQGKLTLPGHLLPLFIMYLINSPFAVTILLIFLLVFMAQFCKSLGMTVTGIKRRESKSTSEFIDKYGYLEDLDSVLPQCDYICCILPSTPQTRNLLSGTILSCCANKKPVLINIGRGDLIDEKTIVTAIKNKWLGGAILDVFEKEPLPEISLLWDLPNVTITPHVSGPAQTQQVAECFVENYTRYINGEELTYKVDWDKGY